MNWAEHSIEIDAPVETSFDAIVDYESFPGWQDAVDSVEVLDRTEDGLGRTVKLFVDAKVRKIDYTLLYSYTRPTEIRWEFVSGNGMRDVDGVYTLESLGPERSRATYKLGADPEVPVPGMVLRRTHKALVKRSVEDLKKEAERRHAAAPAAASPPVSAPAEAPAAAPAEAEAEAPNSPPAAEPAPQPTPAAASAQGEWVPKAEREPPSQAPAGSGRGSSSGAPGSITEVPTAIAGVGLSFASRALRAGKGLAEGALGAGREAAGKLDKVLSGDEQDRSDRDRRS